jgi:hypothetical protein
MTLTEKVALSFGIYGAALSSANTIIQIINHQRDTADVRLKVQKHMVTTDRMNEKYTIITAVNHSKRPVRIDGFAAHQLDTRISLVFPDVRPQVPCIIEEAQTISAWIREDPGGALDRIETYFAFDSLGREFKYHTVSWFRRWQSKRNKKRKQ